MYFRCNRCNVTLDESELSVTREWHSECERDCFEDVTDYGCPKCGREMCEGYLCDCCGNFVPESRVEFKGVDPLCPECYDPEEEKEDERPNVLEMIRRRMRYGEPLRIDERAYEPA